MTCVMTLTANNLSVSSVACFLKDHAHLKFSPLIIKAFFFQGIVGTASCYFALFMGKHNVDNHM